MPKNGAEALERRLIKAALCC